MMITTSDGIRLYVRSIGSGAPLLFVHEFSGDVRSWDAQVDFFSRYYRCTTYCARGYPPSDVPTDLQAYDQVRAAEDLADVVRAVADRSAHIVGLSMGGFAALHFAMRHPRLARSLVLAGVGYGAKPEQQLQHAAAMRQEADHAEAVGMATFARELAGSGYAQCLRAKNEAGWRRFAERDDLRAPNRLIWLSGQMDRRAYKPASALGWTVFESFTIAAPARHAASISVGVSAPGIHGTPFSRHT